MASSFLGLSLKNTRLVDARVEEHNEGPCEQTNDASLDKNSALLVLREDVNGPPNKIHIFIHVLFRFSIGDVINGRLPAWAVLPFLRTPGRLGCRAELSELLAPPYNSQRCQMPVTGGRPWRAEERSFAVPSKPKTPTEAGTDGQTTYSRIPAGTTSCI